MSSRPPLTGAGAWILPLAGSLLIVIPHFRWKPRSPQPATVAVFPCQAYTPLAVDERTVHHAG